MKTPLTRVKLIPMSTRLISPPPTKRRKTSHPTRQESPTIVTPSPGSPPAPSSPDVLRVYSWNINGILPFLQSPITNYFKRSSNHGSEAKQESQKNFAHASLRTFLHEHHYPDVLFLQEVKISAMDFKTQDAVRRSVNTLLAIEKSTVDPSATSKPPTYNVHFTLPTDRHNARGLGGNGKLYGVCSIVRSDLSTKFGAEVTSRTVDWDSEGRISIIEINSDPSTSNMSSNSSTVPKTKLALFNIYAVNGTDNPYKRPTTGEVCGTRHDRKLEFHTLLVQECISMEKQGWDIVLAGDMNVAPERIDGFPKLREWPRQHVTNRADFNEKFLSKMQLTAENDGDRGEKGHKSEAENWYGVDVWRALHPEERRYTYYPTTREWGTSCDRVDYFVASKKLYDEGYMGSAGILDSEEGRGPSDHVPIWVDIRIGPEHNQT